MAKPKIAGTTPIRIEVEAGKKYFWCTCGESSKQPFCDGAHKTAGEFTPEMIQFEESKTVSFCTCKLTKKSCLCDGSHKTIESE